MLGKRSLNHGWPRAACRERTSLHMPLILLSTPWHPSQLLLETGDASSWTDKGCTPLLLQACAQALRWMGGRSPNPRLWLCQKGPHTVLHQPALEGGQQQGLCKRGEMQRQTSPVSLRGLRVSSTRGSTTFGADCEGKQNKNLIH